MIGEYRYQAGELGIYFVDLDAPNTGIEALDAAIKAHPDAGHLIGGMFAPADKKAEQRNRDRFPVIFEMLCDLRPELADDPAAVALFRLLAGYGAKIGGRLYAATVYGDHMLSRLYVGPVRRGGSVSRNTLHSFDQFDVLARHVTELVRVARIRTDRKATRKAALDAAKAAFENPLVVGTVVYEHFGVPRYYRVLKVTPMGCTVRQLEYADQIAFESDLSPGTEFRAGAPEVRARYTFRATPSGFGNVVVALKIGRRARLYIWDEGA